MGYLGNKPDAFQYTSTSYQSLSGDGVTTTFTLSRQVSANGDIEVVVNNVPQEPGVAYYVTNLTNLNFTAPPSAAANNIYIVYRAYVQSGIAPAANTVTTSAIAANTIQPWQLTNSLLNPIVNTFTANGTGTTYTLSFAPPSANAVVVTVNGITQNFPENYSTNDTVLTFTDPPASNSVIRVLQQAMIGTSIVPIDGSVTTSKLASGLTLSGSTTLSGNLTVAGTTTLSGGVNIDSNTLYIDNVNNLVGIGTASPTSLLSLYSASSSVVSTDGDATVQFRATRYSNDSSPPNFLGRKARGTFASPTAVNSGDTGASFTISAYGGSNFRNITQIQGIVDTYTSDTNISGYLVFSTNGGSTAVTERMRITSAGNVGIGLTNPTQKLEVTGSIKLNSGVVIGERGTAAAPAYSFSDDTDTGMFNISNTDLGFSVGGTERMRIDSSGNVGIGVTPSAWRSINRALQIGTNTCIVNVDASTNSAVDFGTNFYFDSSGDIRYLINSFSGRYRQQGGNHTFSSGGSGTAGNTITETQLLSVGIGTSLALQGATPQSGTGITFPATQSASSNANTLDDYEEGTWTPIATSSTGSITSYVSAGRYTKIGRTVFVQGRIALTNVGTAGGRLMNSGLPFTSSSPAGRPAVFLARENAATGIMYGGWVGGGDTTFDIATLTFTAIAWVNNYDYTFSFTYEV